MKIQLLAAALLTCCGLVGQNTSFVNSGCNSPVQMVCTWSPPRPNGRFVFINVTGINSGDIVTMCYGFSTDTTWSTSNLPLPFDMGNLFPAMGGCNMLTSAVGTTMSVATSPWFTFFYEVNHLSPEITFQVMRLTPGNQNFELSAQALHYWP